MNYHFFFFLRFTSMMDSVLATFTIFAIVFMCVGLMSSGYWLYSKRWLSQRRERGTRYLENLEHFETLNPKTMPIYKVKFMTV